MDWSRHPNIQRAANNLWAGELVAYPTEAVWGLGCNPDDEQAVLKLLALKQRDYEKGMILVAADIQQVEHLLAPLTEEQRTTLKNSWPGPNTWLVPDLNHQVPQWVKGQYQSVALRVSDHPVVRGLCKAFGGPIVSTSANPQGKIPALHQWQVRRYFGQQLSSVTPGAVGAKAKPTEIRDLVSGQVIRPS
ncbi:MAG: L-threonylcarbamoyladenylate synthase [Cellvibrionaceae bacterium]